MKTKQDKWCKRYCFEPEISEKAKQVCNKPNCRNEQRASKLAKKYSEKILKEIEMELY